MSFLKTLVGGSGVAGKYAPLVKKNNSFEPSLKLLSDEALRAKTDDFRERLTSGVSLDDILPEAFAVVREASQRTLGQRHYDVQLLGGMALHEGRIAEMKPGEGKTVFATLPAYLKRRACRSPISTSAGTKRRKPSRLCRRRCYSFLGLS